MGYRKKLYVADPDLNKLVAYDISHNGDALSVGAQYTVATNVEARWVACDGVGNVYFTDEAKDVVLKIPAKSIEAGKTSAQTLYDGSSVSAVSSPGGIVSDNYFVYWLNKASGTQVGSLIRAVTSPNKTYGNTVRPIQAMANNNMKSYGLCIAMNNMFYTDEHQNLYVVPKSGGGEPQLVSNALSEPRGCAFDGDGAVYVADKAYNAVYQLAANSAQWTGSTPLTKAADFQGAL